MILRKLTSAMILLGAAGMANAGVVAPKFPPMPIVHPLQPTDWTIVNEIAQFDPDDYGGALLHTVAIMDIIGRLHSDGGTVTCLAPDINGQCTGHVEANVKITITLPGGILSTSVMLAFPQFDYTLTGQGSNVAIPGGDLIDQVRDYFSAELRRIPCASLMRLWSGCSRTSSLPPPPSPRHSESYRAC